jgi:AcrR family transcriptional regulator
MNTVKAATISAGSNDGQSVSPARRPRGRPTLSNEVLLDKALDLFLELGYERTSIDAITAVAGVAKRTIYQRYGDKKTLFKAALEQAIEEWIVPISELQAAETDGLEQSLLNIGRILVANIMSPAGLRLLRITNAEAGHMPEIGAFTYKYGTGRTIAYLADLFVRHLGRDSASNDWEEAAVAFLYLVVSGPPSITAWGMTVGQEAIERHTTYCVRLFLNGLCHLNGEAGEDAARDVRELEKENRRLKELLGAATLEIASLRDRWEASKLVRPSAIRPGSS